MFFSGGSSRFVSRNIKVNDRKMGLGDADYTIIQAVRGLNWK